MNKPKVQLYGENGNVYAVIGRCVDAARKAGWTPAQISKFKQDCLNSGSYDEVLQLCMKLFDVH